MTAWVIAKKSQSKLKVDIMGCYYDENLFKIIYIRYMSMSPWGRLNIKMVSYQYSDPNIKDKTVVRPSYL